MADCFFFFKCNVKTPISSAGPKRIRTIIESSKIRKDKLHLELEEQIQSNPNLTINCHRHCHDCVSTYTSSFHINQAQCKRKTTPPDPSPSNPCTKRRRRSEQDFDFKAHCFFCGKTCDHGVLQAPWCDITPNAKNPKRWRKACLCKPPEIDKGFKEKVYDCSGKRNDECADQVRCRLSGALSDLYAVSARYHDDCRKQFMNPQNVARASKASNESVTKNLDIAF